MAFSAWQLLSPVQWARWTWSAVRGGGGPDGEDGGVEGDAEEEIKSPGFRQVHRAPGTGGRGCVRVHAGPAAPDPSLPSGARAPLAASHHLGPQPAPLLRERVLGGGDGAHG